MTRLLIVAAVFGMSLICVGQNQLEKTILTANDADIPALELRGKLAKIFSISDCEYISGLTCKIYYNGSASLPSQVFFTELDKQGRQSGRRVQLIYPRLKPRETGRATFRINLTRPVKIVLYGEWNGPWRDPY
ncbi:MAG TPA: hypothetical protein VIH72_05250 [Candidatus Acidoferrales bacterium]|jgi:hypothetical protein